MQKRIGFGENSTMSQKIHILVHPIGHDDQRNRSQP
jgi:hypothetical protein